MLQFVFEFCKYFKKVFCVKIIIHVSSMTNSLQIRIKSECVKTEFLLLLEREWKGITILP